MCTPFTNRVYIFRCCYHPVFLSPFLSVCLSVSLFLFLHMFDWNQQRLKCAKHLPIDSMLFHCSSHLFDQFSSIRRFYCFAFASFRTVREWVSYSSLHTLMPLGVFFLEVFYLFPDIFSNSLVAPIFLLRFVAIQTTLVWCWYLRNNNAAPSLKTILNARNINSLLRLLKLWYANTHNETSKVETIKKFLRFCVR